MNIGSERKGFGADVAALVSARNDYHHGRGPTIEEDIVLASKDLEVRLRRCIEALAFFTEYPIYEVRDINFNLRGDIVLKCLSHSGDHPGLAQEELVIPSEKALLVSPRKNNLFLDLGRHEWIALYPFINVMSCQNCKAREVYFIDKWSDEKGTAHLKSFERGHSESSSDVSSALIELTSAE